ncbi:hypothetical protein MLD38_027794 [Melastoma candidum]|uniref:Uncharacterized protein n=1 Tax=Melastoma candidum TaxID=119954 RepID=A0ACB9P4C2_9MYRT|nr:hypothetical protein MLD38_027794 [Melastoma candidum]
MSSPSFPRNPPPPSPSSDITVSITSPLLGPQPHSHSPSPQSRPGIRDAARFLRRVGSRRVLREPSMLVRETAAEQLEERQTNWAYSKPVVVLDVVWNFAFVSAAITVLILSREEAPSMPLRVWIAGYAVQCVLHLVCVIDEFRRRERLRTLRGRSDDTDSDGLAAAVADDGRGRERVGSVGQYVSLSQLRNDEGSSLSKHLESANTMFSFIWWIIGFYWVSAGAQSLVHDAPQLYWLCIIFLGFDVFFVVFCVALACVVGIAVCCCLPCIIAILYAVADQEGASKEEIEKLPRYKFRTIADGEKHNADVQGPLAGLMARCNAKDSPTQQYLSKEDAECCICLCSYEDGTELRELPCRHHFHCTCVDKWLHINATCPLCKYNISKTSNHGMEEV